MKYIFDFDDVILRSKKQRDEHIFPLLEKVGISQNDIQEYYQRTLPEGFLLKNMISHYLSAKNIDQEKLYEELMSKSGDFVNKDIVEFIKKAGKENCFLITHGGREFQEDKIRRAGVDSLFSEKIILIGSKKQAVESICEKFKYELVVFIDDKESHFKDLNFQKYPNLKTILYAGETAEELQQEISNFNR